MTVYAPDSDFFINMQRLHFARGLAECGRLPVLVTDVVWGELVHSPNPYANAEMEPLLKAVAGAPKAIEAESAAAASLQALLAGPQAEGEGEHSIIALAIHDPKLVPVLLDKRALHRAVEELRRPVLSMHGFLDALMTARRLPRALGMEIASAYRSHCSAPAPHWWQVERSR